ncbi:MAG: sigma-54-dependent Fis family transcriptional regulator [Planctomycetota bacterium]|jgi:transcriptional regulator with GAF, ATPase, and Fis domain
MDKNEFFREATLRLCGHLEIEEGLRACIEYLDRFMPADVLYLEKYERKLAAMQLIARATPLRGEKIDLLIPLGDEAKKRAAQLTADTDWGRFPQVMITNKPEDEPITMFLLDALDEPLSSVLYMPLTVEGKRMGALTLLAAGYDRFKDHHAELFSTLKEPAFVAMSNTLKHREVVKLMDLMADDNRYLHGELRRISGEEIIGTNFGLKPVMHKVQHVATLDSPVLLLGETGVGKDVIANAIHYSSTRSNGPFVNVNCGAIPDTLIDSELFGHEKGAFTGALSRKRGRFERANKGTIFLDEIGELPVQAQVRLLRVLQSKEIERVGGVKTISLDIRIIAATNRNLEEMVKLGEFREDLWFRLNVFPIWIPPLRERTSDIPALLQHFIYRKVKELKLPDIPSLSPKAIDSLMGYHWPGNVRELENIVERALILNPRGPISFEHFNIVQSRKESMADASSNGAIEKLDKVISDHIRNALVRADDKIHGAGGAAELLGVNASTLRNKMNKLGIAYGHKSKSEQ